MKTFLSFVIACLFFPSAASAQSSAERDKEGLIGPVKSVETYVIHYTLKDGETIQLARQPQHSATYNLDGNLTEQVSYDSLGRISDKRIYTYDLKGRSTGYEGYYSSGDKTPATSQRHIYILDDSGKRIEYRVIGPEGTSDHRFTYKYDTNGNEIEYRWYSHTGQLGGITASTYDEIGNQTGQIAYRADGSVIWRNSAIFDGAGNKIEQIQYEGDSLRYRIISRYDEMKRVLEEVTMEFNAPPNLIRSHAPVPGKVLYTYDDEKRTKEVATYSPDGSLKDRVVYRYDDKGNQIERTAFKSDVAPNYVELQFYEDITKPGSRFLGKLSGKSLVEFEYDSHGNWTRKTYLIQSVKDGKSQRHRIEERVITYQ